ncbi:MAG: IclR family transcriptional regulator [Bryobacteraceae bacterium]
MRASVAADVGGVRVLHKTLDILEAVKVHDSGCRLAELSRRVELPKATVYRILNTLESRGYLDRGVDGSYRLAKKLFDLQREETLEVILHRLGRPVMERMAEETRETVNMGTLDAGEVVVIETVESPQAVRMASKVGNRRALHSTALGKALLAALPDKEWTRLVRMKGLPRFTPQTLVTESELAAEIEQVRLQGYALDDQENELDGRCIGAPVYGRHSQAIAAISISGPVFRMDRKRALSLAPKLRESCAAMSAAVAGQIPERVP